MCARELGLRSSVVDKEWQRCRIRIGLGWGLGPQGVEEAADSSESGDPGMTEIDFGLEPPSSPGRRGPRLWFFQVLDIPGCSVPSGIHLLAVHSVSPSLSLQVLRPLSTLSLSPPHLWFQTFQWVISPTVVPHCHLHLYPKPFHYVELKGAWAL